MPARRSLIALTLAAGGLAAAATGCQATEPDDPGCVLDECETEESLEELLAALDGHGDPVAAFLRETATERGTLEGDYRAVLDGLGEVLGCPPETDSSFVVLSNQFFIPKTLFTRCSSDPQAASRFFLAIPAVHEQDGGRDVDPQTLHLSAWDEAAGTYRIYATRPTGAGDMGVKVSPRFCLGCHGGPHQVGSWQPLMNEMTNPWTNWNAEPGFRSQLFDEFLDPVVADAPVYQEITAAPVLDSASNLEPIIRAGIERFNGARALGREEAADVEHALALVRPLFCDETINFVSEVHGTGELRASAVVDPALAQLMRGLGAAGGWPWLTDTSLRVAPSPSMWEELTLIPVRGESTVAAELSLVSRGVLTPLQAARVRALDWTRPVFSELRCGLYRLGAERVSGGAIAAEIDALPAGATNADLVPILYRELMRLQAGERLVELVPPDGADLLAVPDAYAPGVLDQLAAGDLAAFGSSIDELGAAVHHHVSEVDRAALRAMRQTRACRAIGEYPITPIYPDLDCD